MPVLTNQLIVQGGDRTYHVHVPANPCQASVPAIIVFHGGGQDVATIAGRWGVDPPIPSPPRGGLPPRVPRSRPPLGDEWVHFTAGDSGFPTYDLEFVTTPRRDHHPAVPHRLRPRSPT